MKKIMLAICLAVFAATPAFAAVSDQGQEILDDNSSTIANLSANVCAEVLTSDTSYAAVTKATKGTKVYGTASDDTSLYAKNGTANATLTTDELSQTSDSSAFDTGWTEM